MWISYTRTLDSETTLIFLLQLTDANIKRFNTELKLKKIT
jgi:hypothetical protein